MERVQKAKLPAVENLLLRAQGLYYQEKEKREVGIARWQRGMIAVALVAYLVVLASIWISAIRDHERSLAVAELTAAVQDIEAAFEESREILAILVQRDVERQEEMAALRLRIARGAAAP